MTTHLFIRCICKKKKSIRFRSFHSIIRRTSKKQRAQRVGAKKFTPFFKRMNREAFEIGSFSETRFPTLWRHAGRMWYVINLFCISRVGDLFTWKLLGKKSLLLQWHFNVTSIWIENQYVVNMSESDFRLIPYLFPNWKKIAL